VLQRALGEQGREDWPCTAVRFSSPAAALHEDLFGDLDDQSIDAIAAVPVAVLLRVVDHDGNMQTQLDAMRSTVAQADSLSYVACLQTRGDSLDDLLRQLGGDPMAIMQSLFLTSRARPTAPQAADATRLAMEVAQSVVHSAEPQAGTFANLSPDAQARLKAVAEALAVTLS